MGGAGSSPDRLAIKTERAVKCECQINTRGHPSTEWSLIHLKSHSTWVASGLLGSGVRGREGSVCAQGAGRRSTTPKLEA
jgi:hypothetical protein